ncbi:MAG: hypothetical protein P4L87_06795 [Formivibrio sp.]|nr:hypothetical protein [Formivibrio sp.]
MILKKKIDSCELADILESAKIRSTHDIGRAILHVVTEYDGGIVLLADSCDGHAYLFKLA